MLFSQQVFFSFFFPEARHLNVTVHFFFPVDPLAQAHRGILRSSSPCLPHFAVMLTIIWSFFFPSLLPTAMSKWAVELSKKKKYRVSKRAALYLEKYPKLSVSFLCQHIWYSLTQHPSKTNPNKVMGR